MSRLATEQPRAVWCCSKCGAIYHKDFPRCPADGAEVVMAESDPLLGSIIGNYTIDELIGEGGMGRVYLAHHANLPNKRYAFKVLLGDHAASTAMRARFTREAERASQLDHPNVVKVVDFGQTRHGLLYIVMDYVDGPSLVSLIGESPMAPIKVVGLIREICKGLVYAHAAGIVHRDLKPENILVSPGPAGPVPRIVDFGLALSVDQSDARLTESGMTMGTPAFAAPEQLSGKPIDHRADLYALGMTMFEMLTGGLAPFEGHLMEVVSARTTKDAPRISERAPELGVPQELDDIVARLTRRKPAERFASARELIDALDAVHFGAEARMPTEVDPPSPPAPRRRRVGGIWGAVGVVAATALAAVLWPAMRLPVIGRAVHERPPVVASAALSPVATGAPAQPATPAVAPQDPPATDPEPAAGAEIEIDNPPEATASVPSGSATAHAKHKRRHREPVARPPTPRVDAVAIEPASSAAAPALTAPPLPVVPPVPPRELRAKLDGMDVNGSLSAREVERAIERRWAAITRCVPGSPETVVARFTIGEAKHAKDVSAAGPSAQTNACVIGAFTDVRTEAAPDVGDVQVTVRIAFVVKT